MKTNCCIAACIMLLTCSAPAFGDVRNDSSEIIYVKLDGKEDVRAVPAKTQFRGKQDGLAIPARNSGSVFKTVRDINAVVHQDGTVSTFGGNIVEKLGQLIMGGWKEEDFVRQYPSWKKLYEKSEELR